MHCVQCDVELTDFEATRKNVDTGVYLDLCNTCFAYIDGSIRVHERYDLLTDNEYDTSEGDFEDGWEGDTHFDPEAEESA